MRCKKMKKKVKKNWWFPVACQLRVAGAEQLELSWIDEEGEAHAYGSVAAYGRRIQQTYAGHVWQVTVRREADATTTKPSAPLAATRRLRLQGSEALERHPLEMALAESVTRANCHQTSTPSRVKAR